jgi:hypothetical protein
VTRTERRHARRTETRAIRSRMRAAYRALNAEQYAAAGEDMKRAIAAHDKADSEARDGGQSRVGGSPWKGMARP